VQVGFIGLGHMGQHMARHVAEAGHDLAAFDLRPEAVAELVRTPHARRANSVAEAASGAEVVFTSLPGPPEVEAVATGPDGLLESMQPGSVYIDLSSNSPKTVRKLHAAFAQRGISMLDAPVAGGVTGAEAATLSIMVGGDRDTFERVRPVLSAIGPKLFYCGPSGNGAIVKLCNNLSSQAQIAAAGEILSLGVKAGVDLEILASAIGGSTGTCRAIVETFPKQLFRRNPLRQRHASGDRAGPRARGAHADWRDRGARQAGGAASRLGTPVTRRVRPAAGGARRRGAGTQRGYHHS
jgi:3-hydroxyisobutyrate dehydrogenase-like beta-hydroxyacid dehydrogenase